MPASASAPATSLLILRHEPSGHLGYFANILENHNISFVYSHLNDALDLGAHDGVIALGGPQSANDPHLSAELHFLQQALDTQTPVLGICLGAQLIAKALGSHVYRSREKEIGWAPIFFTDTAAGDPVFGALPSPATFCHWHSETFTLPPGAELLAYSDKCRHQAFRFRRNVYGIQFHPELTPEMIADWFRGPAERGSDAPEGPIDPYAVDTAPLARSILEGWLSTI
jgi:GMP synthase-like glutamine amidotransferase